MTLRQEIVAEIMKLASPPPLPLDHRPTIDELEKMLNADPESVTSINPDGTVSVRPKPHTVGDVADAVLRVLAAQPQTPAEDRIKLIEGVIERQALALMQIRTSHGDPVAIARAAMDAD